MSTLVGVMIVLFLAALVKSAIGFGESLTAMPLLSFLISVKIAAPMVALLGAIASVLILVSTWRDVDLKSAWRLLLGAACGVPLGLYILQNVPEQVVLTLLGVLLVVYGLYSLFSPKLPTLHAEWTALPFGFVSGMLGGTYNTGGPPIVVYASLRRWESDLFRSTLQTYFTVVSFMIAFGHLQAGLWVQEVFVYLGASVPGILLAVYLGGQVNERIPQQLFARIVYAFLIVIGLVMIF